MTDRAKPASNVSGLELVETMHYLERVGLNRGKAGNASSRCGLESFQITPSGVTPQELSQQSMVTMTLQGEPEPDGLPPSSEWRMHKDIYRARPDISAIVHTHSTHATALACTSREIPAFIT